MRPWSRLRTAAVPFSPRYSHRRETVSWRDDLRSSSAKSIADSFSSLVCGSIAFVVGAFAMGGRERRRPAQAFWVLNNACLIAVLVIGIVHILEPNAKGPETRRSSRCLRSLAVCAAVADRG